MIGFTAPDPPFRTFDPRLRVLKTIKPRSGPLEGLCLYPRRILCRDFYFWDLPDIYPGSPSLFVGALNIILSVVLAFTMPSTMELMLPFKGGVVLSLGTLPTLGLAFLIYFAFKLITMGRREKGLPPGPPTVPILGNLHQIPLTGIHTKYLLSPLSVTIAARVQSN